VHAPQAIQDLAEVQPNLWLIKAAACLSHAPDQPLEVSCKHSQHEQQHQQLPVLQLCGDTLALQKDISWQRSLEAAVGQAAVLLW
jgi:hypothetical protein